MHACIHRNKEFILHKISKWHKVNQVMDTTVGVLLLSTTCIQHSIARNEYQRPYSKDNGASNIFKHLGQIFEEAEIQDKIG